MTQSPITTKQNFECIFYGCHRPGGLEKTFSSHAAVEDENDQSTKVFQGVQWTNSQVERQNWEEGF